MYLWVILPAWGTSGCAVQLALARVARLCRRTMRCWEQPFDPRHCTGKARHHVLALLHTADVCPLSMTECAGDLLADLDSLSVGGAEAAQQAAIAQPQALHTGLADLMDDGPQQVGASAVLLLALHQIAQCEHMLV